MKTKKSIANWKSIFPLKNLTQFRQIGFNEINMPLREHFISLINSNEKMAKDDNLRNIINAMSDEQLGELKKYIKQEPNRKTRSLKKHKK